jgi:deazaflavin-dependent oxidoreductase (nitroreductase family)
MGLMDSCATGGTARHNPAWYQNLAAHPDRAEIAVGGKTFPVTVTQLSGAERDAAGRRIVTAQPQYARFASKTSRVIPALRLTAA